MAPKLGDLGQNVFLGGHRATKNDRQTVINMLKRCASKLAFQQVPACLHWLGRRKVRAEKVSPCPALRHGAPMCGAQGWGVGCTSWFLCRSGFLWTNKSWFLCTSGFLCQASHATRVNTTKWRKKRTSP